MIDYEKLLSALKNDYYQNIEDYALQKSLDKSETIRLQEWKMLINMMIAMENAQND